jgi:hypothetical protein
MLAISTSLQACGSDITGPELPPPPPPPPPSTAVLRLEIDGREVTLHDAGVYTIEIGDSTIAWGVSAGRYDDKAGFSSAIIGPRLADGVSYETGDVQADADGWMGLGSAETLCTFFTNHDHRGELFIESVQNGRVRGHFRAVMKSEHVHDDAPDDCGTTEVVCNSFDLPLNPDYLDESMTKER